MTGNRKENIAGNIAGNIARGLTGDKAEEEENVNTRTEKETEFMRESDILFRRMRKKKIRILLFRADTFLIHLRSF